MRLPLQTCDQNSEFEDGLQPTPPSSLQICQSICKPRTQYPFSGVNMAGAFRCHGKLSRSRLSQDPTWFVAESLAAEWAAILFVSNEHLNSSFAPFQQLFEINYTVSASMSAPSYSFSARQSSTKIYRPIFAHQHHDCEHNGLSII